jgi:predicted RNA methylase
MKNIRQEMQEWLELVARTVKNIPFDKEVIWEDIEDVYNGLHSDAETPIFDAYHEKLSYETVYCDAVGIDHMCQEILKGDFAQAMKILKRYRGVVITNDFAETLQ